jgi:hypothetical protein
MKPVRLMLMLASAGLASTAVLAQTSPGGQPSAPQTTTKGLTRSDCQAGWRPDLGITQQEFQSLCLSVRSGEGSGSGSGSGSGGSGGGGGAGGAGGGGAGGSGGGGNQ